MGRQRKTETDLLTRVVKAGEFDWADKDIFCCNACGATGNPVKHYDSCGGMAEVRKWEAYYNDPEWSAAFDEDQ